ncbi:MAG: NAD(P)/FAD-dependent oxidoreductase [Rhizonema sp. PD38]|nr:NAD(P)/FAD-dependent oxidoreductase [Rhizonema sp. PD38]
MNEPKFPTVILGAGFVGLFTALHLSHNRYNAPVVLVDKNARFCFKPLLYEYLSGEMSSNQVMPAYNTLLKGSNVGFVQGTVQSVDLQQQQVQLVDGTEYQYENLVLALGSVPAFFAEGARENALSFQSQADVDALKNQLQTCLKQAVESDEPAKRSRLLTVVIVGSGPAGVELAMTLGDLLPNWYEAIGGLVSELRIVLVSRGDILKGDVNSHLGEVVKQSMQERTVPIELLIGASVTAICPNAIKFVRNDQAERLEAETIIWTGGSSVNPLIKELAITQEHRTKRGQLHVMPTLQLPDYPQVFAAGDCAAIIDPDNPGTTLPATAQVAYQQGRVIAHNIIARSRNHHLNPCHVVLRGTLMKLGLGTGVANLFDKYQIGGARGHRIRHLTYLELLPTPLHNIVVTHEWIREKIFHLHAEQSLRS